MSTLRFYVPGMVLSDVADLDIEEGYTPLDEFLSQIEDVKAAVKPEDVKHLHVGWREDSEGYGGYGRMDFVVLRPKTETEIADERAKAQQKAWQEAEAKVAREKAILVALLAKYGPIVET